MNKNTKYEDLQILAFFFYKIEQTSFVMLILLNCLFQKTWHLWMLLFQSKVSLLSDLKYCK